MTMPTASCFNDTSSTGILRALPESDLLAAMRDHFGVDIAEIRSMNHARQLRMVDACRFLNNNLPGRASDSSSQPAR